MRVKTSVMLPEELLQTVDTFSGRYKSRSQFIEAALRMFIAQLIRDEQNARDLEIINRRADYLNQETLDALTYQVPLFLLCHIEKSPLS